MKDKKHIYQSESTTLPPLKSVLGEVPDPDPEGTYNLFRAFGTDKTETEARDSLVKLIRFFEK
jgi:hypothetical protein